MNKRDLIEAVAIEAGVAWSTADKTVNATLNHIMYALEAGEKVHLVRFGTFDTRTLKPRMIKDIRTNTQRRLPQRRMVVFSPGKSMKEHVR